MQPPRASQNSPEHIAKLRQSADSVIARRQSGEGFIYVAAIPEADAVKIGHSLDPAKRVQAMQLRLLGFFPATMRAERTLHKRLAEHRHPEFDGREVYRRTALAHLLSAARP